MTSSSHTACRARHIRGRCGLPTWRPAGLLTAAYTRAAPRGAGSAPIPLPGDSTIDHRPRIARTALVLESQSQLKNPGIAGARNPHEVSAGHSAVRIREIHIVEQIEGLEPELELHALPGRGNPCEAPNPG